jgi:Putative addiction module component
MDTITYQVTIKEEYASGILEDLRLNEAIEVMPNDIPQWQINETRRRLAEMKSDPPSTIDGDDFFETLSDD